MLPAPLKDENFISISESLKVREINVKQSEENLSIDKESVDLNDVNQIKTNVTEIRADDLINKEDYYKGQLRNHSLAMFKKQTLERQKGDHLSQIN